MILSSVVLRTTVSRTLFATLLASCGDDKVCHLDSCGNQVCTNFQTDPANCGACGVTCTSDQTCTTGQCMDNTPACAAPMTMCTTGCVDTQTAATDCGACDAPCGTGVSCITGKCAAPLVTMQTSRNKREVDRDLYELQDVTFTLTQLNTSTFATSRVIDHATLPDGRVVFVASNDTEGVFELYLATPAGGAPTKLNPALVAGGNVQGGILVRNSTVLYRADEDVVGEVNLYAVDLATPGTAVKVNGTLAAGARVTRQIALSDDATKVAYIADQDTQNVDEAYLVDLAAPGVATKISAPTTQGMWDLQMSGDAAVVVLRTDDLNPGSPQLFVVHVATPGVAVHVDNATEPGYRAQDTYAIAGGNVVYSGGESFLQDSLYAAPLAGATIDSTQLATSGPSADVRVDVGAAPDNQHVLFRQQTSDATGTYIALFVVDLTAPATPTQISPVDVPIADFAVSPNGKILAFRAGSDGPEGGSLERGTFDPGFNFQGAPEIDVIDLTAPTTVVRMAMDANLGIEPNYIPLDDGRVVFHGDVDVANQADAYIGSVTAADTVVKISPPLDATTDATDVSVLSRF